MNISVLQTGDAAQVIMSLNAAYLPSWYIQNIHISCCKIMVALRKSAAVSNTRLKEQLESLSCLRSSVTNSVLSAQWLIKLRNALWSVVLKPLTSELNLSNITNQFLSGRAQGLSFIMSDELMLFRKIITVFQLLCNRITYTVWVECNVSQDQNRQYIVTTAFSYVSGISSRYAIV